MRAPKAAGVLHVCPAIKRCVLGTYILLSPKVTPHVCDFVLTPIVNATYGWLFANFVMLVFLLCCVSLRWGLDDIDCAERCWRFYIPTSSIESISWLVLHCMLAKERCHLIMQYAQFKRALELELSGIRWIQICFLPGSKIQDPYPFRCLLIEVLFMFCPSIF